MKTEKPSKAELTANFDSDVFASIHGMASDLFEAGLMEKKTMREFDALCLTPVTTMDATQIRAIREQAGVSQSVFAKILNVTTNSVGQWERNEKHPTGSALKLLSLAKTKGIGAIL
jgi:putative transcriptional regulator